MLFSSYVFYNWLGGYFTEMVQGILLGLGALAGTWLSEALASPTDASSCEAHPPYIVLRTALRPSLRLIFFIILIPAAWRRLHWYFHVVNLHSVGLHGARLARRGAVTYTTHVFASSCMALVRCIIFASLVFWNKFSCRIFQRFECRPVHAMLLQCLLYHNLIY